MLVVRVVTLANEGGAVQSGIAVSGVTSRRPLPPPTAPCSMTGGTTLSMFPTFAFSFAFQFAFAFAFSFAPSMRRIEGVDPLERSPEVRGSRGIFTSAMKVGTNVITSDKRGFKIK